MYTFTAADGSVIDTIDTNASALAYDNTASGLTQEQYRQPLTRW
ncbi:hypothetical protein [Flavobacterium alkalisoli]|nr:hypothetical protein [Flavobacterium alkalisoli]